MQNRQSIDVHYARSQRFQMQTEGLRHCCRLDDMGEHIILHFLIHVSHRSLRWASCINDADNVQHTHTLRTCMGTCTILDDENLLTPLCVCFHVVERVPPLTAFRAIIYGLRSVFFFGRLLFLSRSMNKCSRCCRSFAANSSDRCRCQWLLSTFHYFSFLSTFHVPTCVWVCTVHTK